MLNFLFIALWSGFSSYAMESQNSDSVESIKKCFEKYNPHNTVKKFEDMNAKVLGSVTIKEKIGYTEGKNVIINGKVEAVGGIDIVAENILLNGYLKSQNDINIFCKNLCVFNPKEKRFFIVNEETMEENDVFDKFPINIDQEYQLIQNKTEGDFELGVIAGKNVVINSTENLWLISPIIYGENISIKTGNMFVGPANYEKEFPKGPTTYLFSKGNLNVKGDGDVSFLKMRLNGIFMDIDSKNFTCIQSILGSRPDKNL